jgi:hypothetical protein
MPISLCLLDGDSKIRKRTHVYCHLKAGVKGASIGINLQAAFFSVLLAIWPEIFIFEVVHMSLFSSARLPHYVIHMTSVELDRQKR